MCQHVGHLKFVVYQLWGTRHVPVLPCTSIGSELTSSAKAESASQEVDDLKYGTIAGVLLWLKVWNPCNLWPARSSCYPMRHRFCRVAHVLMVDAARFGPVEYVGERPESLWYRNLLSLPSQDVSWSRSRSAVVLLSLPFLLLPLRAAAF